VITPFPSRQEFEALPVPGAFLRACEGTQQLGYQVVRIDLRDDPVDRLEPERIVVKVYQFH
jgi:hypothetical protein